MNSLTQFTLQGESLGLEYLEGQAGLAKGTLKGIFNAWISASVIDERGALWVRASKLHTILRTKKDKARYLLGGAARRDKAQITRSHLLGSKTEIFVRSTKVCEWVNELIQAPLALRTADYLRYSEAVYRKVRDCKEARLLRTEFQQQIASARKSLKKQRQKRLKLKHDELTGKSLSKGANFAHIRAACIYFEMADKDWNGVLVNAETHLTLTKEGALDEGDLLRICEKKKWQTDWHSTFKQELRLFEKVGEAA